jgi:glycosyltransferase involved in cell wall biosynthesis
MKTDSKSIAIIHDILMDYGGAERVLEAVLEMFPDSDLYTFYNNHENKRIQNFIGKRKVYSSIFQKIPHLNKIGPLFSFLKPFSWWYFYRLNLSNYSGLLSFSSSFNSKLVRKTEAQFHVTYIHTPPKYLYSEKNELEIIKKFPFNFLLKPFILIFRRIDKHSVTKVDKVICNSKEVKKRILRYYKVDAKIVHPPILTSKINFSKSKGKYFIFHSRLVKQKGIELAVKTFKKYSLPLVVIGDGYLRKRLIQKSGKSTKFLGFVSDKKIPKYYKFAKALIYCSQDEDFGLVPVEAMNFGVPVIAFNSGAIKETVIDKVTGILFDKFTEESLYSAIIKFESTNFRAPKLISFSRKFNKNIFQHKFREILPT